MPSRACDVMLLFCGILHVFVRSSCKSIYRVYITKQAKYFLCALWLLPVWTGWGCPWRAPCPWTCPPACWWSRRRTPASAWTAWTSPRPPTRSCPPAAAWPGLSCRMPRTHLCLQGRVEHESGVALARGHISDIWVEIWLKHPPYPAPVMTASQIGTYHGWSGKEPWFCPTTAPVPLPWLPV